MLGPELSIIIVSYNTKRELKNCLQSIYKQKDVNFEVIIADNNSTDSSVEMIKKNFSNVNLIENKKNLGFARAVNQGLRITKGGFILLLNPDTKITEGTFENLVGFAKTQKNLGAVGPKLLNPDGSPQASCYNLPSIKGAILEYWLGRKGAYEKYLPKLREPIEVEALVGAAMLVPRPALEKVGYFDERFFLYFEDLDWCRRARTKKLKIFWYPQTEVIHQHGASAEKLPMESLRRLQASSRIYNGPLIYWLITLVIRIGQLVKKE